MQNSNNRQHSLREKLKSSICCFTGHEPLENGEGFYNKIRIPRTPISPSGSTSSSSWFKLRSPTAASATAASAATATTEFVPRVRGRSLKSRMGRKFHNRNSHSADFSYDPSSYALNFENDIPQEVPFRSFSSRLPASPPPAKFPDQIDSL